MDTTLTVPINTDLIEPVVSDKPLISTKPANFALNELVYIKGIRFKITYFNQGKHRMTLEHYPYSKKEIEELKTTIDNQNVEVLNEK